MAVVSRLVVGKSLAGLPAALAKEARRGAKVMVVSDSAVAGRHGKRLIAGLKKRGFEAGLTVILSGERSKKIAQAEKLYRTLARANFERQSWLIALGGGVVGDLTGFVAATYLRGIPFVQAPTTLLAQVDAAIGGKTGVDIPEGKNLVGSFYHPRIIWIDPTLLKTLPARHWRNGLAEVIKYGAIRDAKLFDLLERKIDKLVKGYSTDWLAVIKRCAEIKMEVVAKDPTETKGLRAILNFGHTVGHAVEAAGGYRDYLHGEAISIGMFVAAVLSEELAGLDTISRIRLGTLLTKAGLPARVKRPIARKKLFEFLSRDKKSQDGSVRFILLQKIGQAVSGQSVPPDLLSAALAPFGL
jgi:3-dehydroquinate synthase